MGRPYHRRVTSFPAAARRVRDSELESRDRLLALRECALRFGPYGFRATWHHLMVSAGVPRDLDADPESLVRAVDELEQARLVWMARTEEHAARRRREKAAGNRAPRSADGWLRQPRPIAYCPDFQKHPTEPLVVVLRRVIAACEAGTEGVCRACGRALTEDAPCPGCGVSLGQHRPPANTHFRWRQIWLRASRSDTEKGPLGHG